MQRAERLAGVGQVAVRRVGGGTGGLGVERDDGVQGGVGLVDVPEVLLEEVAAADVAVAQRGELFAGGGQVESLARAPGRAPAAPGVGGGGDHGRRRGDGRGGEEQSAAEDHVRAPDVLLWGADASRFLTGGGVK
ncbi:hypothetical protein SAV31267_011310 [Streptomyces avermitilis]|uniref:Uncharacterized protein n=1 Tax=Streptomyces avermitilis TaxID=33903 RepID=A0A4D4MIM2_STRAX|nr:hypothetical protein SAV31267_011310 [Streptomyces avermitilis]